MTLDARTLMVVVMVLCIMSALSLSLLWRIHRRREGPSEWALGLGLCAVGSALLVARGAIPDILSVLAGNMLLLAGLAAIVAGNLAFSGRKRAWPGLALAIGMLFVLFALLYDRPEHFQTRVMVSSVGVGGLSFWAAWALRRTPDAADRDDWTARRIVAVAFFVNGLVCVARLLAEVAWLPAEGRGMWTGTAAAQYYLWSALITFGVATGFPIMVTERLRNELRARVDELDAARRTAEGALREHRNFLSMISHEFRTPLGIINAAGEVIACNLPQQDAESAGEVSRIRRATRRLSNLVEGCLTDEWLTTASQSVRAGRVDLRTVLEELASEYGVALKWQMRAGPVLQADPYLLPIALSCIIDNACKYGRSKAGVRIEVRGHDNGGVVVEVHDDGPGIPAGERARVFEKYYRAPQGLHRPGTGLGLFLARRIVHLHGGSVEIVDVPGGEDDDCAFRLAVPPPSAGGREPRAMPETAFAR